MCTGTFSFLAPDFLKINLKKRSQKCKQYRINTKQRIRMVDNFNQRTMF